MTNPRIYRNGKLDKEASVTFRNRAVPTEPEIESLLRRADKIENEYYRLRAKAIIGLVKVFGKRRIELTLLEMADIHAEGSLLYITFTIAKKHKKGMFQYIKFLQDKIKKGEIPIADLSSKSYSELHQAWETWAKTEEGIKFKIVKKPKATPINDKYGKLIFEYYSYMLKHFPRCQYFFPSGVRRYILRNDQHLTGRHLLRIVKQLDKTLWLHLFRKGKGSEVAKKYGRTLDSAFQVKETLDLERTETALRYIEENVPKLETGET